MSRAVICLGANQADAEAKIRAGWRILSLAGCRGIAASDIFASSSGYGNQVVELDTCLPYEALLALTKSVEHRLGRVPEMKAAGIVPIDIDIVVYDGEVVRQADYQSAYFREGMRRKRPF